MVSNRVGVFGATGHTGRFVAAELKRRGVEARWIGRDGVALEALRATLDHGDVRLASIDDPGSLEQGFQGLDAVINCAGPFLETSRPVIAAGLAAGCHVLDITAEQGAVLDTIATFDAAAKKADRVVLPAMAFFGGLADLVATSVIAEWTQVNTIDIAVALDSWRPTAGTRITGARNTASRLIVRDGALSPVPTPAPTTTWHFPEPFGSQPVTCVALSEIIALSRHVKADAITSYMTLKPLADLADETTPPPEGTDALGRSDQLFALSARVRRGTEERQATVSGRDIYAITAPIVVEACVRLLGGTGGMAGVRVAGELFDAKAFLAALGGLLTRSAPGGESGSLGEWPANHSPVSLAPVAA